MEPLGSSASLKCEEFVFIVAIDLVLLISAELCRRYRPARLGDAPASGVRDARLLLAATSSAQMLFLEPDC